ncbi:MAG: pyrimidine 5'-nucleotidase [Anaerolineales bacterium]
MHKFTTIFFDLDDTLYDKDNGLWQAIRSRMGVYMETLLGLPPDEVAALRREYYIKYGTTLRGLQIHHQVDSDDYLAYVHDLVLEDFLHPDPDLVAMLKSLPLKKYIFTNADAAHAQRVLKLLGVNGTFDGIFDVRALDFMCKPDPSAYHRALELAGVSQPDYCLYLDDSPRNLSIARQLGITTILVGDGKPDPSAHYSITSVKELPEILPELWSEQS